MSLWDRGSPPLASAVCLPSAVVRRLHGASTGGILRGRCRRRTWTWCGGCFKRLPTGASMPWTSSWTPDIDWRAAEGAVDDVGEMHGPVAVRKGRAGAGVPEHRRSPRSRGAVGVGDVAGGRGDGASNL